MSKDIKKALEHCVEWNCGNCPNRDELGSGETVCRGRLLQEVLEYVADLETKLAESEIKCYTLESYNNFLLDQCKKLIKENKKLTHQHEDKGE